MPEDAGKQRIIRDLLQQIKAGEGFIEDISIDRIVRPPGSKGEGSTAISLSMRPVSNITQLLEDDLKYCFDEGYFTFRFVAALVGSGKTSLLTYLHELTKTKPTYSTLSVVVRFQLSDLLNIPGNHSFSIKLYCHILAQTFWELLNNKSLSLSVNSTAERILRELLDDAKVAQLISANNFKIKFYPKFTKYLVESGVGFEDFFFYLIDEVSSVEPLFTFVYLTDELDALQQFSNYIQDSRSLFKALIKRAKQYFKSKVRLLIYLVGTSDNVKGFISDDPVLESILDQSIINLNSGYRNELELIRAKIDTRIEGAYRNYKNFNQAWKEIKDISLDPAKPLSMRQFCQSYGSAVLAIHEKYFYEGEYKRFEGNARQLVEAKCNQMWADYLKNKAAYQLSNNSTTTVQKGHAFDCYLELLHNDKVVARAFGEAKNYELLSGHLDIFKRWLEDLNFNPSKSDGHPPDLAFMIAPSCPSLLKRKLELQNIQFIPANKEKKDDLVIEPGKSTTGTKSKIENPKPVNIIIDPDITSKTKNSQSVNINTADKNTLIAAFMGTKVRDATLDRLTNQRKQSKYTSLDDLVCRLKFTDSVRKRLQEKLDNGEISF